MTIVPDRAPAMLGSTRNSTVPLPLPPLAPAVIVIHPEGLATVHAQPDGADTAIDPVPPNAVSDALVGLSAYVHGGGGGGGGGGGAAAADCVTVKVRPAIVNTPLRSAPVFAAAVKPTEPLPVPAAPDVTVSQAGALLTAVHAHVAVVVTPTCPDPPPAAIV